MVNVLGCRYGWQGSVLLYVSSVRGVCRVAVGVVSRTRYALAVFSVFSVFAGKNGENCKNCSLD